MNKFTSIDSVLNYKAEDTTEKVIIKIGMSTCGIAAGANLVYDTFEKTLERKGHLDIDFLIQKVGCLGLCFSEPNVEIIMPGFPNILYGKVDSDFAVKIIEEHIIDKTIINERLYDRPSVDVLSL